MAKSKQSNTRNTGENLVKSKRGANLPDVNKATQFKKGYDPRRNLKGRPKSFDQLRALALDIAEQVATAKDGTPIKWNGQEITFAEFVLLSWVTDKKYLDRFTETAYGKVPDEINMHFDIDSFVRENIDLFTDGQLVRIRAGESPLAIVAELIRDIRSRKDK